MHTQLIVNAFRYRDLRQVVTLSSRPGYVWEQLFVGRRPAGPRVLKPRNSIRALPGLQSV